MDLSLEQRLLRFLAREEEDERRTHEDLRSLTIDERVLEGECIQDAVFAGPSGSDVFAFTAAENASKFRPGDALSVGDGRDFERAHGLIYHSYDARTCRLVLRRDRFARAVDGGLEAGRAYCVDRRPLGVRGRLHDVVRDGFADAEVAALLRGELAPSFDAARRERARARLAARGLDAAQVDAGAAAIGSERLALIQGPPGTGKTRLLAEIVVALCAAGCRIALTAFTHRAVDNVLLALRRLDRAVTLIKLGPAGARDAELQQAGVQFRDPRDADQLPARGAVVAGTCFALARLPRGAFHFTVFDEAAQLPIPHAIAGLLLSRRWIMLGDHRQLPPVVTARHADREITSSVFEHLHALYGSHLLDVTYRMNAGVCAVVSEVFYGGALRSAPQAAARQVSFRPGGVLDDVIDPGRPAVLARVDHLQPGMRSLEEANLVADLAVELVGRHGVPAADIAVVAPFRAQVRVVRSALQRRLVRALDDVVVDTVERMQGQEREVVILSLAVGDPDTLQARAGFFFSTSRLNVALSRARTKVIVVASRGAFAALPADPESLRAAAVFKRLYRLLPQVDLTAVYAVQSAGVAADSLSSARL